MVQGQSIGRIGPTDQAWIPDLVGTLKLPCAVHSSHSEAMLDMIAALSLWDMCWSGRCIQHSLRAHRAIQHACMLPLGHSKTHWQH